MPHCLKVLIGSFGGGCREPRQSIIRYELTIAQKRKPRLEAGVGVSWSLQ